MLEYIWGSFMKYIFLINSFTIGKEVDKVIKKINEYAKNNNLEYKVEINSKSKSTEDILKKYKNESNIIKWC